MIKEKRFRPKTLLDTGSDLNILNKEIIPIQFWHKTQQSAIGLGNQPTQLLYEIPEATLCFQHYCLSLKFLLIEIPVACILGTPFFVVVEPHGSARLPNKSPGYFISIPSPTKTSKISIQLPFVSIPRISSHIHTVQKKVLKIEELKGKMIE